MKRILLAEDEPEVLRLMRRILEHEGYEVLAAADVATARRLLRSGPVDLLLSDIDLPDGSGLELCRWTCSRPALRATKVILSSGRLEPDLEQQALDAGAVAFIAKPFNLHQFTATIRSHVPPGPVAGG
jgi:DNA-binding response OmpR family regulator